MRRGAARCPISCPASKGSSPSRRRSPNPTRKAAPCATAASTSRTWSARSPSATCGDSSSTARSRPACHRPNPSPCRSTRVTSASTSSPRSPSSPPSGVCGHCSTSTPRRPVPTSRSAVTALSYVAQAARGQQSPMVPQSEIDKGRSIVERFMIRWRGEPDPRHVKAVDAYWTSAAEHGMNASTFTARVIASTGADVAAALSGAVGAMSGPLHGGAPSRVLGMLEEVERTGDAAAYVRRVLDSGERLMGFGHRVYRAEDPRARVLRRTAKELGAPRFEVAEALEKAALDELHSRRPDRVLATNVEFWAAIMLDFAEVPAPLFTSMFTCARTAGWSAHILEQKRTGRLVRPSARYTGPGSRTAEDIEGYGDAVRVDG
ncbi:citrate (Si)-synthase [Streptomyces sp. SPB78]|nr:citrate (Si)-synthase [Streptomyces sp. SPB78]